MFAFAFQACSGYDNPEPEFTNAIRNTFTSSTYNWINNNVWTGGCPWPRLSLAMTLF